MHPIALKDGGVAWNDDIIVQHIIQTAEWKRPIYFATSVAPAKWKPYEQYLETQGFVMRLVPRQGSRMLNAFLMKRNFERIYRFTRDTHGGLQVDKSLYKEKDIVITLNNYGVAAAELANALAGKRTTPAPCAGRKRATRFAPRLKPANVMLGVYYFNNNQRGKAIEHYRNLITSAPGYADYWLNLAWIYSNEEPSLALRTVDEALPRFPDDRRVLHRRLPLRGASRQGGYREGLRSALAREAPRRSKRCAAPSSISTASYERIPDPLPAVRGNPEPARDARITERFEYFVPRSHSVGTERVPLSRPFPSEKTLSNYADF